MNPRPAQLQSDNDSLQADVMRFMAIIAFCLIAILALVKNVEPVPSEQPNPKAAAVADQPASVEKPAVTKLAGTAARQPITEPDKPTPAPVAAPEPPAEPVAPQPRWTRPIVLTQPAPEPPAPTEKPVQQPQPVELDDITPPRPQQPSEPAVAESPEDEGLSLRFATDADFLRLIARGKIRVFAFNEAAVLGLTSGYEFQQASAPGQVYELMPQTIPTLIFDSLTRARRSRADAQAFTWGITLPPPIQKQISTYVDTVSRGQLVIDRYGKVHHVSPS